MHFGGADPHGAIEIQMEIRRNPGISAVHVLEFGSLIRTLRACHTKFDDRQSHRLRINQITAASIDYRMTKTETDLTKWLDPLEWGQLALNAPDIDVAWSQIEHRIDNALGGTSGMFFDLDLSELDRAFPDRARRFGVTHSAEWEEFMDANPERVLNDPVKNRVGKKGTAITFRTSDPTALECTDGEKTVLGYYHDHGLMAGLNVGFLDRQRGCVSALNISVENEVNNFMNVATLLKPKFHLAASYFVEGLHLRNHQNYETDFQLTPRERECLLWANLGRTTQEIADILSLSVATVSEYLTSATKKLNASNRVQACARFMLLEQGI